MDAPCNPCASKPAWPKEHVLRPEVAAKGNELFRTEGEGAEPCRAGYALGQAVVSFARLPAQCLPALVFPSI